MSGIKRPALRYRGGKWNLAPWIISHFPEHGCYVEPYAGAASVLLQKPRSSLEVYNDLDGRVVNFFCVLRERPDDLVRAIHLTPYARAEYELSYNLSEDPVEDARRLYIRAAMAIGATMSLRRSGWRLQIDAKNIWKSSSEGFSDIGHLYQVAERFRGVQIECEPALSVITRYDREKTLFYLDPPYLPDTRSQQWRRAAYVHEMTEQDHIELAETVQTLTGSVIISGYPSDLYDELYEGWTRVETQSRTNGIGARIHTEALWLSPGTWDRLAAVQSRLM